MAEEGDFTSHDMPHIRMESFRTPAQYAFPKTKRESAILRKEPHEHAKALVARLRAALGQIPAIADDARITIAGHVLGANVEIETSAPATPRSGPVRTPDLDFPGQNILVLRSRREEDRTETAVVFVPDNARDFLIGRIEAYGSEGLGNRPRPDVNRFEPIEEIRPAPGRTLFSGDVDFDSLDWSWWEIWVAASRANAVEAAAAQAGFDVHQDRLRFPETVVLFVRAVADPLATFIDRIPGLVAEVRRASGNIEPFLELTGEVTQHDWVADLAGRIVPPGDDAPAICVIDSGVSSSHPLIAPALAGAWAVDAAWGTGDDHPHGGHGTPMAGAVLHGDLFWRMNDTGPVALSHQVESVKFLPPNGFPPTRPPSYGTVTQAAVSVAEITRPNAVRSFCIASSATDFAADVPSSWSGALDQIGAGSMLGERQDKVAAKDHPKRLILVASGNVLGGPKADVMEHHSIEDPAQSWNALTIGGYTAKGVGPADAHLVPLAGANEKSPFSSGSQNLVRDLTPIKPEVLFEAGNMVVDNGDICDWHPAVSLLGTGSNVAVEPLVPFWATSAASALAGNFLGRLKSAVPGLWPETYRALIVQSAEWPTPIRSKFIGRGAHWKTNGGKAAKQLLLREVGYGVPNLSRAIASARSDLTLLAQADIKPFTMGQGTAIFNEVHFYALPWPREALEAMENDVVTMKVTLSYFVEPNLTGRAATRPDTYRSFGLRFDLKKRTEGIGEFRNRLSKQQEAQAQEDAAAEEDEDGGTSETSYWLLGPRAIHAGSLHCDIWRGHGVDLASHDHIAVYPVGGWWKSHLGQKRAEDTARYCLAVSITAEGQDVDLYSEVVAKVEAANVQTTAVKVEAGPSE